MYTQMLTDAQSVGDLLVLGQVGPDGRREFSRKTLDRGQGSSEKQETAIFKC